jgi:hypothetical protein
MKKDFTINIPDEYWIDSWENNNSITYSYDGPEKIYVRKRQATIVDWSIEQIEATNEGETIIEIDATEQTDVAHFMVSMSEDVVYEFENETNPDGSIYKRIINPKIQDLFYMFLDSGLNKILLKPIYKKTDSLATINARKKLDYVKKYNNTFEFETDIKTTIDKFISDTETYLIELSTVYPWKYIEIPDNSPKIPTILIEKFASLPTNFFKDVP